MVAKKEIEIPYQLRSGYESNPQKDWSLDDIAYVDLELCDGSDEPNFTWIVRLKSNTWLAVRGWHDFTGWDCQSGLSAERYKTKKDAMRTLVDWERVILEGQK
jgi:hypothetical protein